MKEHGRFAPPTRPTRSVAVLAVALALSSGLWSCNIVGPAFYFIHGPEKADARFTLPPEKSVLIFVDDRENILRDRSMRAAIARAAEQRLLDGGGVPKGEVVSSDGIASVTAADRWGKPMGIAQVGEALNADIVIYATIDAFAISTDGASLAPKGQMRVKVVETATRNRLWPGDGEEWGPVSTAVPRRDGTLPTSTSAHAAEEYKLAQRMGNDLANVFLSYEVNPRENEIGR